MKNLFGTNVLRPSAPAMNCLDFRGNVDAAAVAGVLAALRAQFLPRGSR